MALPVVILGGGLGTRMRPRTLAVPKPMLEVAGEPFVALQLRMLARMGYHRVILSIGYLGEMIEAFVGDGTRFGLDVAYVYDGERPLGTAGAIAKALPLLGDAFLVVFGDAYLRVDHAAVERAFVTAGTDGLMTIYRADAGRERANVRYRDGRIVAYDKQAPDPAMEYVDYGLSAFRSRAFAAVLPGVPADLTEVNQRLIAHDQLAAYVVADRPYEIGSPAGLDETECFLAEQGHTAE